MGMDAKNFKLRLLKWVLWAGIAGFPLFPLHSSWARVKFGIAGVGTFSRPRIVDISGVFTPKFGFPGGGLLLEIPFNRRLGFELDALYLSRVYDDSQNGLTTLRFAQGIAGFRYHASWTISFLVGGYYGTGIGKIKVAGDTATYKEWGFKTGDYGLVGGLGLDFHLGRVVAFFLEGRYTYGLSNNLTSTFIAANPSSKFSFDDVVVLAGFRFGRMK